METREEWGHGGDGGGAEGGGAGGPGGGFAAATAGAGTAEAAASLHGSSSLKSGSTTTGAQSYGLKAFSAAAKQVMKSVQSATPGEVEFEEAPQEVCFSENVDLRRWSMIVNDSTLQFVAHLSGSRFPYFVDATIIDIDEFVTSTRPARSDEEPSHVRTFRARGATRVTDAGVLALAQSCPKLRVLDVGGAMGVSDLSLSVVAVQCQELEELHIPGCHAVEGPAFTEFALHGKQLCKLNVSGCRSIAGWAFNALFEKCKDMVEVDVSYVPTISDLEIKVLAENCKGITKLSMVECPNVSDLAVLAVTQHCAELQELKLRRTSKAFKITDISLLALGDRSALLRHLDVGGCESITDVGIAWVSGGCRLLEHLYMSGCGRVTNAGLRAIGENCHDLQTLDVGADRILSDVGLRQLSEGCPRLDKLVLSGLYLLTDGKKVNFAVQGMPALLEGCRQISHLDLTGCFQVGGVVMKAIGSRLPLLKTLILTGCKNVPSKGLIHVFRGCPDLRELSCHAVGSGVTNAALECLGKRCSHLTSLNIAECNHWGGQGLLEVAKNCTNIQKLDISNCEGVNDYTIIPFCDEERGRELTSIYILDCPRFGDPGIAWLANSCGRKLSLVSLRGSSCSHAGCRTVRDRFRYSSLHNSATFFGFYPVSRWVDRMIMNDFASFLKAVRRLQAVMRGVRTRRLLREQRMHELREFCATQIQSVVRGRLGRLRVAAIRAHIAHINAMAAKVTSVVFVSSAKAKFQRRIIERRREVQAAAATQIQRIWRGVRGRQRFERIRLARIEWDRLRHTSAIELQCMYRNWRARKDYQMVVEYVMMKERLRNKHANTMQRLFRGHVARSRARRIRRQQKEERERQYRAAWAVQKCFRSMRLRLYMARRIHRSKLQRRASTKIQCVYRGRIVRTKFWEQYLLDVERRQEAASRVIQGGWRVKQAALERARREEEQRRIEIQRHKAATCLQRLVRGASARREAGRRRKRRDDLLRRRHEIELWAAVKLQSFWRGQRGRERFERKLRAYKGRWKELFDETRQRAFFYNQLTGEIRWRRPQDLLDLLPRPMCNNCETEEAATECSNCKEFFCETCWNSVHYGGKRAKHEFRSVYDYYGKRVDYGDGEFPSKWPTEIEQDEMQGWLLRVEPIREPLLAIGDWEQYADEEKQLAFYFNKQTHESTYNKPIEFYQPDESSEPLEVLQDGWAKYQDGETGYQYWHNHELGQSSFEHHPALTYEAHSHSGSADYQHYHHHYGSSSTHHTEYAQHEYDSAAAAQQQEQIEGASQPAGYEDSAPSTADISDHGRFGYTTGSQSASSAYAPDASAQLEYGYSGDYDAEQAMVVYGEDGEGGGSGGEYPQEQYAATADASSEAYEPHQHGVVDRGTYGAGHAQSGQW